MKYLSIIILLSFCFIKSNGQGTEEHPNYQALDDTHYKVWWTDYKGKKHVVKDYIVKNGNESFLYKTGVQIGFSLPDQVLINPKDARPDISRSLLIDTNMLIQNNHWNNLMMVDTTTRQFYIRSYEPKTYAFIPNHSDTLIIQDTIWNLSDHIIRYIKIANKVYPLKPSPLIQ